MRPWHSPWNSHRTPTVVLVMYLKRGMYMSLLSSFHDPLSSLETTTVSGVKHYKTRTQVVEMSIIIMKFRNMMFFSIICHELLTYNTFLY